MLSGVLEKVLRRQHGVLTRKQALACGLTRSKIAVQVRAGRWRRLTGRVYATFTGPPPRRSQLWAVVLRAGPGAVLSHETAAELAGLTEEPASTVHVTIPANRRVLRQPGMTVHVSSRLAVARHPTRLREITCSSWRLWTRLEASCCTPTETGSFASKTRWPGMEAVLATWPTIRLLPPRTELSGLIEQQRLFARAHP